MSHKIVPSYPVASATVSDSAPIVRSMPIPTFKSGGSSGPACQRSRANTQISPRSSTCRNLRSGAPVPSRSSWGHSLPQPHGSGGSGPGAHGCFRIGSCRPAHTGWWATASLREGFAYRLIASKPCCLRSASQSFRPVILAMAYNSFLGPRGPLNRDSSRIGCSEYFGSMQILPRNSRHRTQRARPFRSHGLGS